MRVAHPSAKPPAGDYGGGKETKNQMPKPDVPPGKQKSPNLPNASSNQELCTQQAENIVIWTPLVGKKKQNPTKHKQTQRCLLPSRGTEDVASFPVQKKREIWGRRRQGGVFQAASQRQLKIAAFISSACLPPRRSRPHCRRASPLPPADKTRFFPLFSSDPEGFAPPQVAEPFFPCPNPPPKMGQNSQVPFPWAAPRRLFTLKPTDGSWLFAGPVGRGAEQPDAGFLLCSVPWPRGICPIMGSPKSCGSKENHQQLAEAAWEQHREGKAAS